jgi:hypothetical protein
VDKNKEELFIMLAEALKHFQLDGKQIHVVTTLLSAVRASPALVYTSTLEPCNHKEADTRMLLHAKDCVVSVFVLCVVFFSRKVVLLLDSSLLALVERFVVLLYDKSIIQTADVNKARHMLSKQSRSLEKFPQTQVVLHQHIRQATFQGGNLWGSMSGENPVFNPSPSGWGWQKEGSAQEENSDRKPLWTTLP